jgi:hypothetical protein
MNIEGGHHIPEEQVPRVKVFVVHETADWPTASRRIGWMNVHIAEINLEIICEARSGHIK